MNTLFIMYIECLAELISEYCLCCRYPDTYVRNKAVDQLRQLPPDDLYDLLPQLVQVRHQVHGKVGVKVMVCSVV